MNPNGASFGAGFAIPPLGRWFGEGLQTGEWRMADGGGGQMADGGGQMADGGGQMAEAKWRMAAAGRMTSTG